MAYIGYPFAYTQRSILQIVSFCVTNLKKHVVLRIFNIFWKHIYAKVLTNAAFSRSGVRKTKIYDYDGKKNLCGERVRAFRLQRHLSQAALAARLQTEGISIERDSISRIEIGTRFVADYELQALAKVLEVSVAKLLVDDEVPVAK